MEKKIDRRGISILPRTITIVTIRSIEQTAHTLLLDSILKTWLAMRKISVQMSEEKQDKESKKVIEKMSSMRHNGIFKNKVAVDNIRKEINFFESLSRWSWPQKYKHLTGQFFSQVLTQECRKAGLPANTFEHDPPEDMVKHSPIPLKASPAFPKTISAQIGHRSSRMEYSLEFTGRLYTSPKWTIDFPVDTTELYATQQKCIFLG